MSELFHDERCGPLPEKESIWVDLCGLVHVVKHVCNGFGHSIETKDIHGQKHTFKIDEFEEFEPVIIGGI